jgi:hypothetical protein
MQLPLDHRRTWFPAYGITLTILTIFLLGVRLAARFQERGLGWDDALITAGWVLSMMMFGFGMAGKL